jgi:hypothetical protein
VKRRRILIKRLNGLKEKVEFSKSNEKIRERERAKKKILTFIMLYSISSLSFLPACVLTTSDGV